MAFNSRRKRKNGSELDTRIQALREDFDTLQHDMRQLLNSLGTEASNRVSAVTETASEVASNAAEQVEEGTETVREAIKSQPFAAIALSMGAGALIGSLLRR